MKSLSFAIAALALAIAPNFASAQTIVLDFEGLNSSVNEGPGSYYAGGAGTSGTTGGPNYGITFSPNTITGCTASNPCANTNSAGNPSGSNIIFFQSGSAATMNVASGFDTGFSFFYSAVNQPGLVNVFDGLNGTGSLLASLLLPVTASDPGAAGCFGTSFCPYFAAGVSFAGTALSVDFGGATDQIGFDDITLGSAVAGGGVPEPATWALMILGFGLTGAAMRRKIKASEVTFTNKVRALAAS